MAEGEGSADGDEPDWMRNFVPNKVVDSAERKSSMHVKKFGFLSKDRKESYRDLLRPCKGESNDLKVISRDDRNAELRIRIDELVDEEFLLEEYDSGGESGGLSKRKNAGMDDVCSSEDEEETDEFGEEEVEAQPKVYFCSRTHSQLSQFMKELRKTKFGSELKVVCLGSRKNLCINEGMQCCCLSIPRFRACGAVW